MSSLVYVGEVTDPSTGLARSTFTDHPGEVVTWLCDGYRYRFNQHRAWRARYVTEADPDQPGQRRLVCDGTGVRLSQPVLDYTSVAVNWTRRTLVFTNPPQAIPRTQTGAEVGIDRGVVHHAVTSDGDFHDLPITALRDLDRRVQRHQKAMARARKIAGVPNQRDYNTHGRSRRYQAHETTIKALKARAGRIVEDQQHKLTTDLIRHYDHIAVEDLNLTAMLRSATPVPDPLRPGAWLRNGAAAKRGLNRAIAGARMGRLVEMLTYKADLAGVTLTKVDPRYTSQRCNQCGHTASENREPYLDAA